MDSGSGTVLPTSIDSGSRKGYGNEHNAWYPPHALPQDLIDECDTRIAVDPTTNRRNNVPTILKTS